MIKVLDRARCCGCSACESACPVGAIEMVADAEGFGYPCVDEAACVSCDRCDSVCPFLAPPRAAGVLAAYAARSLDAPTLLSSSSGGVFTELCRPVLESGGAVYGVSMDDGCRGCSFARATDGDGVAAMRGSKYLQADARGVYRLVREDLDAGREVLFSGTPCQVNALASFLGDAREGALLVDFACHGVPSPRLWSEFVSERESSTGLGVSSVDFRCKEVSWRRFGLRVELGSHCEFEPLDESPYLRMFLRNVCLRPSCYDCRAKGPRSADVTIADFWGIESVLPEMADELGCSLVITHTARGEKSVNAIRDFIEIRDVGYEDAIRANSAIVRSVERPDRRDRFFDDLDRIGYAGVAEKYGKASLAGRAKRWLRGGLGKLLPNRLRGGASLG